MDKLGIQSRFLPSDKHLPPSLHKCFDENYILNLQIVLQGTYYGQDSVGESTKGA